MKVLLSLIATFGHADEKKYSNNADFLTGGADWLGNWSYEIGTQRLNVHLGRETAKFFELYFGRERGQKRHALRMTALLADVRGDMAGMRSKCSKTGRRRRDDGEYDRKVDGIDPIKDFNGLFNQYANWNRMELLENCPQMAMKQLKRIDRLRLSTGWNYCNKVDNSSEYCKRSMNTGKHPRTRPWVDNKYGPDADTSLNTFICEHEGPDQLSCPTGGTIHVESAEYGRKNANVCKHNGNPVTGGCANYVDLIKYVQRECEGRETCTVSASNSQVGDVFPRQDPCWGVRKYLQVRFRCGDYEIPQDPENAAGYTVTCEHNQYSPGLVSTMDCPYQQVIKIESSEYGRWNSETCTNGNGTTRKCDRYVDVSSEAAAECEGMRICIFRATNQVTGVVYAKQDPCRGTTKYTRTKYTCVDRVGPPLAGQPP